MQDSQIVDLYWARSEDAITQTNIRYGSYCRKVAMNIVANREDSEECVNDTYMSAWNSMPQERPRLLAPFLAAICRNHALDLYRKNHSKKRGEGEVPVALDELSEVASSSLTEDQVDLSILTSCINDFLAGLEPSSRKVFVRRYFYADPLSDIASAYGMSESGVKSLLFRQRGKLKEFLEKEGYEL